MALRTLLKSRAVKLVVASNFVAPIASFASGPILARGLGVDDRGVLAGLIAVLILAPLLFSFGQQEASVWLYHKYSRQQRFTLHKLAVASVCIGVVGGVTTGIYFFQSSDTSPWMYGLIGGVYVVAMTTCMPLRGWLIYREHFSAITIEKVLQAVLRLVGLILLLVIDRMSVEAAFVVHATSTVAGSAALVVIAQFRRGVDGVRAGPSIKSLSREASRLGGSVWIGVAGAALILRLDQVLMPYFSTFYQLGLYVVAATVAEAALLLSNALRVVALPHFIKGGRPVPLRRGTLFVIGLAIVSVLVAWVSAPGFIAFLFGEEFRPGAAALVILAPAVVLAMWLDVVGAANIAAGCALRHGLGIVAGVIVAAATLPLLLPGLGAVGAAVSTLLAYAASLTCALIASRTAVSRTVIEVDAR